jgi:hypothetical protein
MQHRSDSFEGSRRQILCSLLRLWGFDTRDFEVEDHETSGIANMLGLDGGIITVRCHSTGEERFYPTGPGSVWFGSFFRDLGWGHFGRASRATRKRHHLEKLL